MLKRSELNKVVNAYILECVDGESYESILNSDGEKLQFVLDCFRSEFLHPYNLKRYGSVSECFRQWLMGLPSCFNVDFENYKILELAKKWQCIPQDASERQEDKILENWFSWITNKTFQLMKKNGVIPF